MSWSTSTWQSSALSGPTSGKQTDPKIVGLTNGNFVVVYVDDTENVDGFNGKDIIVARYDPLGTLISRTAPTFRNVNDEIKPAVAALPDGGFAIAYYVQPLVGATPEIVIEKFNASGARTMSATIIADYSDGIYGAFTHDNPTLAALADGTLVVGYEQYSVLNNRRELFAKTVDTANVIGGEYNVKSFGTVNDRDMAAREADSATDTNGNIVTVFVSGNSNPVANDLFDTASSIDTPSGSPLGGVGFPSSIEDAQAPSVAALTGGGYALAYQIGNEVFMTVRRAGLVHNPTEIGSPNAWTTNPVVVALQDGNFVVLWNNITQNVVEGQRFNTSGIPLGSPFEVPAPAGTTPSQIEAGLTSDGRILVTFRDFTPEDIYHAILDPRDSTITGSDGDDVIVARLDGGTIIPGGGADTVEGRGAEDIIDLGFADSYADLARGGNGNDRIIMRSTFAGEVEQITGGDGTDTFEWTGTAIREVDLGTGQFRSTTGTIYATVASIENVVLSGVSNSGVLGSGEANRIEAIGAGANHLRGRGGDDTLLGGTGADTLDGGMGFDVASYVGSSARVVINLFTGEGFEADAAGDTLVDIEAIIGSGHGDIIVGTGAGNLFEGGNGDDTIYGNVGNDTILGGFGADLVFGEGDDDLVFGWLGADLLWGGEGDDVLWGEQDSDTLLGETGDDVLLGIDGDDVMYGWVGNDTLYGWTGNDVLWGEQDGDQLFGEDGNDTFIGGLGRDTMAGGAGADRFFSANFEIAAGEVDLITDFDAADRYLFQTGAQLQYFNFNAPGYGAGAGIHVQVAGGVFILDVFGATTAQLQAQTQFF